VTGFDGLRCAVTSGDGVIARFPGVLCVVPTLGPRALSLVPDLIELCRQVAGEAPGRVLGRRLATWLGGLGTDAEGLAFGTLAAADAGRLAVFLLGEVQVSLPGLGTEVSGADAAAWADRLLAGVEPPVLLAPTAAADQLAAAEASAYDLRLGVVPGAAAVLLDAETARGTDAPIATASPTRPNPPAPLPPRGEVRPHRVYAIPEVPVPSPEPALPTGYLSGAHVDRDDVGALRPPLGRLVLGGGAMYPIECDYLIGRNPEADPRVRSGRLRPITVDDPSGEVSRVHAEIRLDDRGVDVIDQASSNGTCLAHPGQDWIRLAPHQPTRLLAGTRIRIGDTVLTFEAPRRPDHTGDAR
jgi:hypothetical protein